MTKKDQLQVLYEEYKKQYLEQEVVVGDGNPSGKLLLIGEAPGKDEVRLGKPFVGAAGKNLTEFLNILGINRNTVYITNAIKYRLSAVNEKTGRVVNRPAKKEEIAANRGFLLNEIDIIKPQYIVTLGNVPLKSITGDYNSSIGTVHGQITPVIIKDSEYKLYPLYHPASIIYNQSLKETYLSDLVKMKNMIKT